VPLTWRERLIYKGGEKRFVEREKNGLGLRRGRLGGEGRSAMRRRVILKGKGRTGRGDSSRRPELSSRGRGATRESPFSGKRLSSPSGDTVVCFVEKGSFYHRRGSTGRRVSPCYVKGSLGSQLPRVTNSEELLQVCRV